MHCHFQAVPGQRLTKEQVRIYYEQHLHRQRVENKRAKERIGLKDSYMYPTNNKLHLISITYPEKDMSVN